MMEQLLTFIGQTLGITVIHSLWQGLVIWLALRMAYIIYPSLSSAKKYKLSFIALLAMVCWFIYTCYNESRVLADWGVGIPAGAVGMLQVSAVKGPHISPSVNVFFDNTLLSLSKRYLPLIAVLYIGGLLFHLFKLGTAFKNIKLVRREFITDKYLQQKVDSCSSLLPTGRSVVAGFTHLINTPCVVGYLKPLILIPFSLANQLGEAEVEAILLHELAHIKAGDYLQNGIQQACEALLFFNPFARFIGQMVSNERENRCDDLVIHITGDRLTYATTLLKLEENRAEDFSLALAAVGTRYPQLTRIERIMEPAAIRINTRYLAGILLVLFCCLGSVIWLKTGNHTTLQIAVPNLKAVSSRAASRTLLTETIKPTAPAIVTKITKPYAPQPQTVIQNSAVNQADSTAEVKPLDSRPYRSKLYDSPAWQAYTKQRDYYITLPREPPSGISDEALQLRRQEANAAEEESYHELVASEAWKRYPGELAAAKTSQEIAEVKARLYTSDAWIKHALNGFKADVKLYAPLK
jgi:bla regulator protein BlaR1